MDKGSSVHTGFRDGFFNWCHLLANQWLGIEVKGTKRQFYTKHFDWSL